ncbi:uncharacterized protein LOC141632757 [Silene latifolia]|uniref:uncharacterized protein LOC141632757 n=1 Tax=Silene latifolia TaxID=37657 RepID=UPI003D77F757
MGDINCVRTTEERISSDPPNLPALEAFNDAIANSDLHDLKTNGCYFTWTNKQEHGDRKWMRLDRVLVNSVWLTSFPDSFAEALTAGISDHSPLIVSLPSPVQKAPYSFKFLNCWSQDKLFLPLVHKEWAFPVHGCAMYKLMKHLHRLKNPLRQLHKDSYSGISDRVKKLQQRLHHCQLQLQQDPTNSHYITEEESACNDYCQIRNVELNIAYQGAKDLDIKMGDASTSYFFSKIAARRNYSNITKVLDLHGNLCTEAKDISDAFIDYYTSLLGFEEKVTDFDTQIMLNGHSLSGAESCNLLAPITPQEVKAALFSIDSNKSPGPDGYSAGFFKAAWEEIKDSFTSDVMDFFITGKLLKENYKFEGLGNATYEFLERDIRILVQAKSSQNIATLHSSNLICSAKQKSQGMEALSPSLRFHNLIVLKIPRHKHGI